MQFSDVRYLHSKKTVDDRAIHRRVLEGFVAALPECPNIVEIGAGVGTMVSRLADWGYLRRARYTLVDRDLASLSAARAHLVEWAGAADGGELASPLKLRGQDFDFELRFVHEDALRFCSMRSQAERYDAVSANAVLDLMDLRPALSAIWRGVVPDAPYWFTINFDGETILLPEEPLDGRVMAQFHKTMDERITNGLPAGDSKTGRHLLEALPESGARLLEAASSDWVVFPQSQSYPADEAYFLHHIVNTIEVALTGSGALDADELRAWAGLRHEQIAAGRLHYIAHQLDVFGRGPGTR